MTYLSVCSGIEAASVAWEPLGWQAVGFAEIEPFPCEVLSQRFPSVKNYGDITQYEKWNGIGQFGILVGGTPCQSFSVAGLRKGLNDSRGSLLLAYCSLASYYKPRWIVWENVPGVLSSNGGRDFGTFLALLAQCGYGTAYRVLDAQYFGVPQRRRRVYVVGCLGDWRGAAAVLFDSVCVPRNITPRRKAGESITGKTEGSTGIILYLTHPQKCDYRESKGVAGTVTAAYGMGGGHVPFLLNTLKASGGALGGGSETPVSTGATLRRLTPLECERLQGFPDNWTRIEWRGKPAEQCPDSLRYKAIGNSMAVPVMRWIGERIQLFDSYYYIEKKRKHVDYGRLYALLKKGPVSFERIREETGLDKSGAYQVVTTLSLKYPVYSPSRGMYALL